MDQGETLMTSGKFCFATSGWRVGALMALCLLQQARGHVQLLPPQNVTLLSRDFAMILTWAPGEGSPPDVTYTVRYESQDRLDKWMKVPDCKNIPRSFCNLTCALPNLYVKVRARVKALWGRSQSPWVKSQFKDYYSDVELAPPVLSLNVRENSIHVSVSFPLPTCVENLTWKYDLNLWEAGSEDKKKYEGYFRKDTVTINTTALRGNYCFSARALYESINLKHSEFSQPVCVLLKHKALDWRFPLLVVILLFVPPIFVASPFICCLVKHEAKQRKMPQVLDFSQFKAAGPTFHLELSEKEFCSDDLNCTEKPVPQRRTNRALGGQHLPWMASFPSSSEDEDEEEEDSSTLIPYHAMAKRHLSCQAAPAAPGETNLDSGSGSVDRGSVLDLRALGFTLFAERQGQVDTSGSQEETSLYLCSSLGRISLTDVRFPGASEHGLMETGIHGNMEDGNRDERLGMSPLQPLLGEDCAEPHEQHPHRKAPQFSRDYQKSIVDLQLHMGSTSQPREDPSRQLLIPLWTLQLAEDEGIASDCGSDTFTEGTPPESTVLSDAFETSNTEEKYYPKLQFSGYEHSHYLGRI
ncbi:PREDICTED: interferon lambda receptor 1 [Sturnus vulgaris]|uniref:interferon lambda receptor 1 n=1 Tax=Sturnus vulgaris TaxID=9172 RepID=UPI00071A9AC3|nr:PREDICTED: interferon lambda receptor 1 [Sturnus vulgaris]